MNVYLIVSKKGDEYRVISNSGSTADINSDTMVFATPAFAFSTIEQLKEQWPDREFGVYQLPERKAGGDAILWKVSEHDTTSVSYVLAGIKDGKRVYLSSDIPPFVECLADARRIYRMDVAVSTQKKLQCIASKNPGSYLDVDDLHIEHVNEDIVLVDVRQEPLKIKCSMKD